MKRIKKLIKNLEFGLFLFLLKRFCTHELDQWERWKLNSKYGEVFIEISRQSDGYNYDDIS